MGWNYRRASTLASVMQIMQARKTVNRCFDFDGGEKFVPTMEMRLNMPCTKRPALLFSRKPFTLLGIGSTNVHLKRFIEWVALLLSGEVFSRGRYPHQVPIHAVAWLDQNTHAEPELSDCRVFIWIFYPWQQEARQFITVSIILLFSSGPSPPHSTLRYFVVFISVPFFISW